MKYIFIVQGEGRGHLTQCMALEEILRKNGHEVVEILVGKASPVNCRTSLCEAFKLRSVGLRVRISCLRLPTSGTISCGA